MWVLLAIAASLFWGLTYVLCEQLYKSISVETVLAITSFFIFLFLTIIAWMQQSLGRDLQTIASSRNLQILFIANIAALMIAELCIAFSIQGKNATLAGIIETSYPIFIVLFAYFLFRENQLSIGTAMGGLLIISGVGLISYSSTR